MKNKRFAESVSDISGEIYNTCKKNECGTGKERLFTQRELEKCIGERLTRERRKVAPFEKLKQLLDRLKSDGVIYADSYAEAAEELCRRLEACSENAGNTREDSLCGGENEQGTDTDGVALGELQEADTSLAVGTEYSESSVERKEKFADVRPCGREIMHGGDTVEQNDVGTTEEDDGNAFVSQYEELSRRYPYIDTEALMTDRGFEAFCRGRDGSLTELYEGYAELIRSIGGKPCAAPNVGNGSCGGRPAIRALSSTAFSAGSASPVSDAALGLSPLQRDIARRAGISYREYAQLLRDIPKAGKSKRTSGFGCGGFPERGKV